MEGQTARLKINLAAREIEIEGSESFVREYAAKFEDMLSLVWEPANDSPSPSSDGVNPEQPTVTAQLPASFGEYFSQFPNKMADTDRALIAGYYFQEHAEDKLFATKDVNTLLEEQGLKLANTSDCIGKAKKSRKVFAKDGKYKVSVSGRDYINSLLTPQENNIK